MRDQLPHYVDMVAVDRDVHRRISLPSHSLQIRPPLQQKPHCIRDAHPGHQEQRGLAILVSDLQVYSLQRQYRGESVALSARPMQGCVTLRIYCEETRDTPACLVVRNQLLQDVDEAPLRGDVPNGVLLDTGRDGSIRTVSKQYSHCFHLSTSSREDQRRGTLAVDRVYICSEKQQRRDGAYATTGGPVQRSVAVHWRELAHVHVEVGDEEVDDLTLTILHYRMKNQIPIIFGDLRSTECQLYTQQ